MGKMKDLFIDELMMAEWTWNGQPCPESYKQAYHDLHFLSFTFSDIEKSYERLLNRINNIEIKSKRKELFKLAKKIKLEQYKHQPKNYFSDSLVKQIHKETEKYEDLKK